MPTARDRREDEYTPGTAAYHTMMKRRDPTYRIPDGFEWNERTQSVIESHPVREFVNKISPYLMAAPAAGGLGYAAATGTGLFGGAGVGAAGGAGGAGGVPSIGPIASGVPAGLPGAVPGFGEAVAAGGGGSSLLKWLSNPTNIGNILSTAGDVGSVLGSSAAGAAEGRYREGLLQNQRDALRNQQYGTQQGAQFNLGALDLQRQQFGEQARGTRGKQATIGNLLQNIQDVSLNVPGIAKGNITGGLRPSALGPGGRAAGGELARQAMLKLMTPDTFTGGEILTPPELTPIPQPSTLENIGGAGGVIGNILGALGSNIGRPRGTQQPPPITSTVRAR